MAEKQLVSEDEEALLASQLTTASVQPMVLKSAIELGIFDIITATAAVKVDRILRFLACHSIVECSLSELPNGGGGMEPRYGVGRLTKYFTKNDGGYSLASLCLMVQDKINMECW